MKNCSLCKELKPLDEFYRDENHNRWHSQCKTCSKSETIRRQKTKFSKGWSYRKWSLHNKHALRRGIDNKLDIETFRKLIENPVCAYCDEKLENITLDRLDNTQGYNNKNCVVSCHRCNVIKAGVTLQIARRMTALAESL